MLFCLLLLCSVAKYMYIVVDLWGGGGAGTRTPSRFYNIYIYIYINLPTLNRYISENILFQNSEKLLAFYIIYCCHDMTRLTEKTVT